MGKHVNCRTCGSPFANAASFKGYCSLKCKAEKIPIVAPYRVNKQTKTTTSGLTIDQRILLDSDPESHSCHFCGRSENVTIGKYTVNQATSIPCCTECTKMMKPMPNLDTFAFHMNCLTNQNRCGVSYIDKSYIDKSQLKIQDSDTVDFSTQPCFVCNSSVSDTIVLIDKTKGPVSDNINTCCRICKCLLGDFATDDQVLEHSRRIWEFWSSKQMIRGGIIKCRVGMA